MQAHLMNDYGKQVQSLRLLIIDDNPYMRRVIRNLLVNIGLKNIQEANDGISGLDMIRMYAPDVVILDWEMPLLSGPELLRIVRSPGVFPVSDVAVIMLSAHVERWRIVEAAQLGVHEFLKKPVSAKALLDRLVSIVAKPRRMVRLGDYYGPEPRKRASDEKRPPLIPTPEVHLMVGPGLNGTPLNVPDDVVPGTPA